MTFRTAFVFISLGVISPAVAGDQANSDIEELIAQLASPNEAPKVIGNGGHGPHAKYPADWDKKAQERVSIARSKLSELGVEAFPYLFEHFDDDRYCMTVDGPAAQSNHSVGRACKYIVLCWLEPYTDMWKPKNGQQRVVPLSTDVLEMFGRASKDCNWVFSRPSKGGRKTRNLQFNERDVLTQLKSILKRLGLEGHTIARSAGILLRT